MRTRNYRRFFSFKWRQTWIFPLISIAILTIGCTPDAEMKKFLDKPSTELLAAWGPPTSKDSDGIGGQIWTYSAQKQWTSLGSSYTSTYATGTTNGNAYWKPWGADYQSNTNVNANSVTTYSPPQTYTITAIRSFFINAKGIVYRYVWQNR